MELSSINQFSSSKDMAIEETIETIHAMCYQESNGYFTTDYISNNVDKLLDVDGDCRTKMVVWSYQVIDFCKFNRETVEIAMSYLDRFLVTTTGAHALQDRSVYQLAAMASLYTAVKIHEPEAMDPALISKLSRGTYAPDEIEDMELIILKSLQWRLNPPTTLSYVREFMKLIPLEAIDIATRIIIYELAKCQAEFATTDYNLVEMKAAEKAFYSFINALEFLDTDPKVIRYVANILQSCIRIIPRFPGVQKHLNSALARHRKMQAPANSKLSPHKYDNTQRPKASISPRSSIIRIDS
jgi:Cyclin, N-terminal domain